MGPFSVGMAGAGDAVGVGGAETPPMTIDNRGRRGSGTWARIEAWIYDPFLALGERRGMASRRRALLALARGRVLELGAGTGLNLAHYPAAVGELVLTEPDSAMCARLARRVARSGRDATVVAARAEALPFRDGAFDTVVSTLVLCTVEDPVAAVREVRRVLAPGGRLLFAEHVRASAPRLARWHRVAPLARKPPPFPPRVRLSRASPPARR